MRSMSRTIVLCCLLFTFGSGQWLERQVILGDTFGGIALQGGVVRNPVSGNEYIEASAVRAFNPATATKVRDFSAGGLVVFCPPSGKGYILNDSALILDAAADTIIGTTALPFRPTRLAYGLTSNRLYLAARGGETLLVFDPSGDSVQHRLGIGAGIEALLWDSAWNRLYIGVDSDSGVLKALDCTADTLLPDVRIALTNTGPLALSTVSHKLYCAGTLEDSWGGIVAVSTDSLVLVDTVTQSGIPDTMVYSPLTDWLYCPLDESVLIVDCQSDTIRSQLEAPYVTALTVSALDGKAYIALEESSRLMVLDTLDSVVGWIQTPNVPFQYTSALAFRPGRNELYGVTTASRVFVVDASADTVSGVLDYATYLPRQMVHNPAGNKLYLLCTAQDAILIVDSTFGAPKQRPGAVINSDAVPVLNHSLNRLYVADDDELRVIDCNTDSLIGIHEMYGINGAVPVMVPYLNRLYVFSSSAGTGGDSAYVYDCLRDTVSSIFLVSDDVPSAVYDSRSNRVFFACADAPTVRALDPVTNSVVKTFDLVGGSYGGMMTLNTDLGRLYYVDQSPDMLFTIDVSTDSVISSESLHWNIDATFLNRRLGKLYMCGSAQTLVFDCALGAIVDTIDAGFTYSGLMDDRNDKLYLEYGAVVDCRYDSVVTQLDSINSRSTAWDAIDNRVFKATTSRLYVYRDDPYGMEEQKGEALGPMLAVLGNPARASLRLRLQIPHGQTAILALHDVAGRLVRSLSVTRTATLNLDLKSMPAGVYLVSLEVNGNRRTDKVIVQH